MEAAVERWSSHLSSVGDEAFQQLAAFFKTPTSHWRDQTWTSHLEVDKVSNIPVKEKSPPSQTPAVDDFASLGPF